MKRLAAVLLSVVVLVFVASCGNEKEIDILTGSYYVGHDYSDDEGVYVYYFDDGIVKCGEMSGGGNGKEYKYAIDYGVYSFEENSVIIKVNNEEVIGVMIDGEIVQLGACSHVHKSEKEDLEPETIAAFEEE